MRGVLIDVKKNQFIISCPMWANDILFDLKSKRWNKTLRAWTAPFLKQSIDFVKSIKNLANVELSNDAIIAIRQYEEDRKKEKIKGKEGFPAWYKFKTTPRKHQYEAINKGYGLRSFAIFMEQQTGKSKTAIDLVSAHRMENHIQAVLVITKRTLRKNWNKQFRIHCPIDYSIHYPSTEKVRQFENWLMSDSDFKVAIVGWESLSAGGLIELCKRFCLAFPSVAIIGDETHYITNHKSTRTKSATSLGRMSEYRYAMTGTPATEGPMNLYSQFEFLDPNIIGIGDFYAFRNRYAIMGGYHREVRPGVKQPVEIVGYQNLDELMELIGPYSFQVLKKDAYDLPPKRYEVRTVELTKEQLALCRQIRRERYMDMSTGEHILDNILEVSLRMHQIAGGYTVDLVEKKVIGHKKGILKAKNVFKSVELVPPDKNPKILEVLDIVEEYRGHQGIIWAVYQPEIAAVVKSLKEKGIRVGELHGGVPEDDRQDIVDGFERGEFDWIVGNAQTGGAGYTMMSSVVNVFYNNTHKLVDRLQAEDRAWGDGQTKQGIWIDVVAEKSVDEIIMESIDEKQDLSEYIKSRIKEITKFLDDI